MNKYQLLLTALQELNEAITSRDNAIKDAWTKYGDALEQMDISGFDAKFAVGSYHYISCSKQDKPEAEVREGIANLIRETEKGISIIDQLQIYYQFSKEYIGMDCQSDEFNKKVMWDKLGQ
ncbi:hypothetical protein Brsp06_03486 [Brucella sp. NBRC 13694]|uniref:hypothetical protein n=1 Tax=Brucella sp. NBRC 13694 TaxID=3075482 RepID=UPI00309ADE9E